MTATVQDPRESEKTYSQVIAALDQSSDMIALFDPKDRLVFANKAWRELNSDMTRTTTEPGVTFEQHIRALTDHGFVPNAIGREEEWIAERLERHRNPQGPFEQPTRVDNWLSINEQVLEDGSTIMVIRDITKSKRAEQLIQTQNERFNAALANMSQGLVMFDAERRIIVCNERYASMYGLSPEQLKPGTSLRQILERRVANGIYAVGMPEEQLEKAIASVRAGAYGKRVQHINDGRIFEITHSPMSDGGWLATHEDITARKRAEEELVEHRDHLQELVNIATQELKDNAAELKEALGKEQALNKLQREFVSMASHEFRTPLAIIDGIAQRMKRKVDKAQLTPEDAAQRIEKIRKAVARMTRLMESTLAAASMQEGKIEIAIEPCDIGKVVIEACARQQEISNDHVISCDLAHLPEAIQADAGFLEQVLTNLLSNAVKYAPDAPNIEVKAHTAGDQVVISVRDHGIGIDEDDLCRIGERFFRARTSTGIAGTGIGFNIAKTLVEMHDGAVSVESKKGVGSTFTVRLPIAGPDQSEQTEQADTKVV
jgi:PAS domain S-box-containing protein